MAAIIVYIIIPLAVLAILVAFVTIIVKSIWKGRM